MGFCQELDANAKRLLTVYDLAAFCYDYLIRNIKKQAQFLGKYTMENSEAKEVNPNLERLCLLNHEVEQILQKREELGVPFSECMEEVQTYLKSVMLKKYGTPCLNAATIPFFVLLAIDRYVKQKQEKCLDPAPLNKKYCEKSYIYLDITDNILNDAAEENHFPDLILPLKIQYQLQNLIILEKKELAEDMNPPRAVMLRMKYMDEKMSGLFTEKKLRVAVIPFGEEKILEFPIDDGAMFHVEYKEQYLNVGFKRVEKLLETAIENRANIVIFPEYVCNQGTQDAIQKWLEIRYEQEPEKIAALLLVVAGSGWMENSNNVSCIYSYNGRLLGKQYKSCIYSDLKNQDKRMVESLEEPGKETTIVDIDGVGKILVGICRDISEGAYIKRLAEIFRPQFLLVPAWSKSVNIGFKKQLQAITAENRRTCSILCNCCAAYCDMNSYKTEVGMVVTPYKSGSVVEGKVDMISRSAECKKKCRDNGCVFIVDMDFSVDAVMKGEIVAGPIKQHLLELTT